MRVPPEVIEDLRSQADIVDVVSAYVPLKQKGGKYFGLCPFHNEKTPSFSVSPDIQLYYCFGCGASGNAYSFIMEMENVGFGEAVMLLAEKINYRLPEKTDSVEARREAALKDVLLAMHTDAARFYYDRLQEPEGAAAAAYLDRRGVSPKMRIRFGLGYSGGKWDALFQFLVRKGYSLDDILKSGLALPGKSGGYYDRFRERLMFPIFSPMGRVVGFGGRILDAGEPKYLNSPDTPLFDKSKNLYAMNFARKARAKSLILAEGYMDVIALHQAGFANAVAALGTAFSSDHAGVLRRFAHEAAIAFDGDEAGVKAALRALPFLEKAGITAKVLTMPGAKDPDEYIQKFGAEAFAKRLEEAKGAAGFQVDVLKGKYDLHNTDEKVAFTKDVSSVLANLDSAVERDAYTKEIAAMTGISASAIMQETDKQTDKLLKSAKTFRKPGYGTVGRKGRKMSEKGLIEEKKRILLLLYQYPKLVAAVKPHLAPAEMDDAVYGPLLTVFYESAASGQAVSPAGLMNHFETLPEHQKISDIFQNGAPFDDSASFEKLLNSSVKNIKKAYLDKKLNDVLAEGGDEKIEKHLNSYKNDKEALEKLYITIPVG